MSPALRPWPLPTGTRHYEKIASTRNRGQGESIDAAELSENLTDEIAPGYCWHDDEALALAGIRKLKSLAQSEHAEPWRNHELVFFNALPRLPAWRDQRNFPFAPSSSLEQSDAAIQ